MKKLCFCTTIPITIEKFMLESFIYIHEQTGWDISIICDYDEAFQKKLPDYIHYYPVAMKRGVSLSGFKAVLDIYRILKKERFDFVQYSTPNAAFYMSIAAKMARVPIRNYHLMGFRYLGATSIVKRILKTIERLTCKNSTSIECVSNSNLELGVSEHLFSREKATVVWNGSTGGVNLDVFDYNKRQEWRSDIRKKLGLEDNEFVFGFVGRITKDKGVNELLQAFFALNKEAKLLMFGAFENDDNGLDSELMEKAKRSPDIYYGGLVDSIEKYFSAMDVLVLPSYREGFGNVVIESSAMGTPVIVSDIPGPVDAMKNGVTGIVVKPQDVQSLKNAMIDAMDIDYASMGIAAKEYVKTHFDSKTLNKYILERKRFLLENKYNQ